MSVQCTPLCRNNSNHCSNEVLILCKRLDMIIHTMLPPSLYATLAAWDLRERSANLRGKMLPRHVLHPYEKRNWRFLLG